MWRWALAGFLIAFGVLAIFSVGLPFLLAGILVAALQTARGRTAGVAGGLALGIGAACVFLLVTGFAEAVPLVAVASLVWAAAGGALGFAADRLGRLRCTRA